MAYHAMACMDRVGKVVEGLGQTEPGWACCWLSGGRVIRLRRQLTVHRQAMVGSTLRCRAA